VLAIITLVALCCHAVGFVIDIVLAWFSLQGTIPELDKRRPVSPLALFRLLLVLVDVASSIALLVAAFYRENLPASLHCDAVTDVEDRFARAIAIAAVVITAFQLIIALLVIRVKLPGRRSAPLCCLPCRACKKPSTPTAWHDRCNLFRCFICGVGKDRDDMVERVGDVMAEAFASLSDAKLTPGDAAAGLMLVQLRQDARARTTLKHAHAAAAAVVSRAGHEGALPPPTSEEASTPSSTSQAVEVLLESDPAAKNGAVLGVLGGTAVVSSSRPAPETERRVIAEAAAWYPLATAAYGALLFQYMHPLCGCCALTRHTVRGALCRCCSDLHSCLGCLCFSPIPPPSTTGGDCCGCDTAAVVATPGVDADGVVRISLHNDMQRRPFIVSVDHKSKAVVIAIRGTLSMVDLLADADVHPIDVSPWIHRWHLLGGSTVPSEGGPLRVHRAMWIAALSLSRQLCEASILEGGRGAFGLVGVPVAKNEGAPMPWPTMEECLGAVEPGPPALSEPKPSPVMRDGYRLVITGHSLGAGVCGLLTLALSGRYPSVEGFAFAPPGALVSQRLGSLLEGRVWSFLLGWDMVPRLSLPSIKRLHRSIVRELAVARISKPRLVSSVMCGACGDACCHVCGRRGPSSVFGCGFPLLCCLHISPDIHLSPVPAATIDFGAEDAVDAADAVTVSPGAASGAPKRGRPVTRSDDFQVVISHALSRDDHSASVSEEDEAVNPDHVAVHAEPVEGVGSADGLLPTGEVGRTDRRASLRIRLRMPGKVMYLAHVPPTKTTCVAPCGGCTPSPGAMDTALLGDESLVGVFQTREGPRGSGTGLYRAVWASREDFRDIRASSLMVRDHLPDKLQYALEDLNDRVNAHEEPSD
jgi:hypothetical protein